MQNTSLVKFGSLTCLIDSAMQVPGLTCYQRTNFWSRPHQIQNLSASVTNQASYVYQQSNMQKKKNRYFTQEVVICEIPHTTSLQNLARKTTFCLTLSQTDPCFLRVSSTSLWEMEKLLITSNFSFPQCFLPFWGTFCHFCQTWNFRLQTLSVWKSLKFVALERVELT